MSCTFVSMSYNIWGHHHLGERMAALRSIFDARGPDVLSVQELREESRSLIDEVLTGHRRVDDPMAGWACESNIWWRDEMFGLEDYGAEQIGHPESEQYRRLFWVRLRSRHEPDLPPLLYSTAHLTWQGHAQERDDQVNRRVGQAESVTEELARLAPEGPCIFTADMNDVARPIAVMREAGFADCFSGLGTLSPVTHPAMPLLNDENDWAPSPAVNKVYDFQFFRGPVRPRCSEVVDFFHRGIAPSDHKPVAAVYTM